MSTDAFEQLIDVAAPGGGSYPVQRGHRRGIRSPHTFDAARWPPTSLTSPYVPQRSTTAVLDEFMRADLTYEDVPQGRTVKSRDEFKDFLSEWTSAISDIRIRIDDGSYLEGPGFSLAMVRGGGRNDGAFGSIPATGRQVEFPSWE